MACVALAAVVGCQSAGGGQGDRMDAALDAAAGDALSDVAPDCEVTVSTRQVSSKIVTVGVVEWSLEGKAPDSAKIVYRLQNAADGLVNLGGEAPVDLARPGYRTLLLGLKQASDYTFHIEAMRNQQLCASPDYALPTTGTLPLSPAVSVQVAQEAARAPGFIVTSSGTFVPSGAFIIDADGAVVWSFPGPESTTRALMDYEGENMWMVALNLLNEGGQMRYVSMDGQAQDDHVAGLDYAHHDFTVMPGGKVAALAWATPGNDPPSAVVIRSPDGSVATAFTAGASVFGADTYYHANAIHYFPSDDSFTIADRNVNAVVKVSATGAPQWEIGGTCVGVPAGSRCLPQDWQVAHGHHLLDDGTLLLFNNGDSVNHILQYRITDVASGFSATVVRDYPGQGMGNNLGDVQRLPNGNTLVTYSLDGKIVELDPAWNLVQTFTVRVGYSSWRPTLYGAPARP